MIEIPLTTTHICDANCAIMIDTVPMGGGGYMCNQVPNPEYDAATGKCALSGESEDTCISVANFQYNARSRLMDGADELVVPVNEISITYDYPLERPVTHNYRRAGGFTRGQLVQDICATYRQIYKEERESTKIAVDPINVRIARGGLINRNATDGKYGIWGHDIGDLVIEGLRFDANSGMVEMDIGSS